MALRTRTVRQMTITVRTNTLVPEDVQDMEQEQDMAAGIDFGAAEDVINDQLPDGYYCKAENAQ